MSVQWGNKAHKKRLKEQEMIYRENQKRGAGLLAAAIGVTALYLLVLGGGIWLKSQARRPAPEIIQANPGISSDR